MTAINDSVVLTRGLDITVRLTDSVTELTDKAGGGVLIERLIGRYVLDRDARTVWLAIDGRRNVGQMLDSISEAAGRPVDEIRQPVYDLCERLIDLGILEVATPADIAALSAR